MVDEAGFPNTRPGNDCNDINIPVCPDIIQKGDILLSTKKIASRYGQPGYSFGLFNGSFRPEAQIRKLRTYMRLRNNLVVEGTQAIHHMQKALFEMNVQLSN